MQLWEVVDGPKKAQAARRQTSEIQSRDQKIGQACRQNATPPQAAAAKPRQQSKGRLSYGRRHDQGHRSAPQ